MKVHELITKLASLDPGALVVVEGEDNSYVRINRAVATEATQSNNSDYLCEYSPYYLLSDHEDITTVVVLQ